MDQATKDALTALTQTVERGFAAVADDLAAVKAELKSDIASLGEQITGIEQDLKAIRRDLYELADKVENISGYRKEIDHALDRIAAIEKHVGIKTKLAA
jgi:phage shock protein A